MDTAKRRPVWPGIITSLVLSCFLASCGPAGHVADDRAHASARSQAPYRQPSPAPYGTADTQFAGHACAEERVALTLAEKAEAVRTNERIVELGAGMRQAAQASLQEIASWRQPSASRPGMVCEPKAWPGVPTPAAIGHLSGLSSAVLDRALLQLIVADQRAAVRAAELELAGGTFGPARQFAAQTASADTLAITQLRQLLETLS